MSKLSWSACLRRLTSLLAKLSLLLLTAVAAAAPVPVGPFVIDVPHGFQAAQTQKHKKTLITAWTHSVKDGKSKTLLQIEVLESAKPDSAQSSLQQTIKAIAQRRSHFSASPVAHITLAGAPAVRQSWNGVIGGFPVMGVIYSVVLKDRYVVKFLTQDLGNTPTDGLFEAMKAVESIVMS